MLSGFKCGNKALKKFALGYRFLTDVTRIKMENMRFESWEEAYSVLQGLRRGICSMLNIKDSDISACLQSIFDVNGMSYELVFFDKTPGGSGYVKNLNDPVILEKVMQHTLNIMERCSCGGAEMDSSCYSCLRSYGNQKYHSVIKRKYVVEFLRNIIK